MTSIYKVVTDDELKAVFLGTNFGGADHRELLNASILKKFMCYHCGHTITMIMVELGLISKNTQRPLRKGVMYLREAYHDDVINKGG